MLFRTFSTKKSLDVFIDKPPVQEKRIIRIIDASNLTTKKDTFPN